MDEDASRNYQVHIKAAAPDPSNMMNLTFQPNIYGPAKVTQDEVQAFIIEETDEKGSPE